MWLYLTTSLAILLVVYLHHKLQKPFLRLKLSWETDAKSHNSIWSIPGPRSLPLIGTKWIYFWKYKITKLHEAYEDLNKKYGPIVLEVAPFGTPIVHIFDRSDIEKIVRYPSRYPFRPPTEIVALYRLSRPDRYASVGITNEQGEKWQNLRTKLTPQITSPRVLQAFLPALNVICDDFIELLRARRDPETLVVHDFQEVANLMGLEAVCTLMLGRRLGFLAADSIQSPPVKALARAVKQLFISQRDSYYGLGLWRYFPTKTYKDFCRSEEIIYNVVSEFVDKALEEEELECSIDDNVRSIFINILQTDGLDIRDKKSAIIDFIAAGIETLANTLTFMLYYISTHDKAVAKIRDELQPCGSNQQILPENLAEALYTKACLQETYRLQPTAFCLARIVEEDTTLSEYKIKAGTVVLCQTRVACRKEENFKNATSFIPERWLTKEFHSDIAASLVLPFGIGRRTCPGKRFVEIELLLLVAKMVQAFDVEFPEGLETEFEFLLVPKGPVNLILKDDSH